MPRHNLPLELTAFIGRERECAQLNQLLMSTRLLTLTGPGGIGKTRLALRLAADTAERFPDGVYLVDVLEMHEGVDLPSEVTHVLGIHESGRGALESLTEWCRSRQLLLVFESCEHLVDACADLAHRLLVSAPGLRIVATSQQPLSMGGETVWRVPPMSLPAADEPLTTEAIHASDAVQLFVDRARAAHAEFCLTEANARDIAQLCIRLEGLPLAVQLAAAWVGTLAVSQLVDRLDDCIRLLTHGTRTAPTRQQTLRATLDWSHGLLTSPEQRLFRRLAAFEGSFTLDAAESVCGDDTLHGLAELVRKSLLVAEPRSGGQRYRFPDPVWQYARGLLEESGEGESVRERHACFYVGLAEAAAPQLAGLTQVEWLDRLEAEHSNLRAMLSWQHRHGDPEWRGLRLASAIWRFWWLRSYFGEGRAQLQSLLELAGESAPQRTRARALHALGELAFRQGDVQAALAPLERARELFWETRDELGIAMVLRSLGRLALDEGDHSTARLLLEEDLRIERSLSHQAGLSWPLTYLGWLAIFDSRLDDAEALLREAHDLSVRLGDREGIGRAQFSFGHLALERRSHAEAAACFRDSLRLFAELHYEYGIAYVLEGLADTAAAVGDGQRAVWLGGAAAAMRESTGAAAAAEFRARHERWQSLSRRALGTKVSARVWDSGHELSAPQAVAAVLTQVPALPDAALQEPLTRREREVAALVARGASNREIADALVIGERTVEMHVGHALSKIGASSRTQLAVWAVEHGLTA